METGKKIFYLSPDTGKECGNISTPGWMTVNGEKKDDGLSLIEQRESTLLTLWPVEDLQYTVETW